MPMAATEGKAAKVVMVVPEAMEVKVARAVTDMVAPVETRTLMQTQLVETRIQMRTQLAVMQHHNPSPALYPAQVPTLLAEIPLQMAAAERAQAETLISTASGCPQPRLLTQPCALLAMPVPQLKITASASVAALSSPAEVFPGVEVKKSLMNMPSDA